MISAVEAVLPVLAIQEAQAISPLNVKYSVWKWLTMFDASVCDRCDAYSRDEYELENPGDLELMFPYGYFIDDFAFAPMIHPNDRCRIERVRDYDFENELIKR